MPGGYEGVDVLGLSGGPSDGVPPMPAPQRQVPPRPAVTPALPPQPGPRNPYDDVDVLGTDGVQQRMRAQVGQVATGNPESEAAKRALARYVGLPGAVADAIPDEVKRLATVKRVAQDTDGAPVLQQRFGDEAFAAVAHDDSSTLGGIERGIGGLVRWFMGASDNGGLPGVLERGYHQASGSAAGAFRAAAETAALPLDFLEAAQGIGGNPLRRLAEGFGAIAQAQAAKAKPANPTEGIIAGGVESGFQSLVQNALFLPLALVPGGQAAALGGMVAGTGGQSYQKAREAGIGQGTALAYGLSDAVIEYATERLPLSRLIGDVKAGTGIAKTLAHQAVLEIPGEQIATVLQDMNEWAVLNPDKPFSAYLAERPSAAAQTLIATLIGVGGNVAITSGVQKAADAITGTDRRAAAAEAQARTLAEVVTLAEASRLRERDPGAFEAFAQEVAQASVPVLFADAQVLHQSGVTREHMAALSEAAARSYDEALALGADVAIPTADFVSRAQASTALQALLDHVRTAPDAMSAAEARDYMATRGDALRAEIDRVLAEREGDATFAAGRDAVAQHFAQQLQAVGVFTPQANAAYSQMLGSFYAVTAAKLGVMPQDLLQRYPLRVAAQGPAGGSLSQDGTTAVEGSAVPRAKALSEGDRAIEGALATKVEGGYKKAVAEYARLEDSEGGKVLNTDVARELSPDYLRSAAVHEPASLAAEFADNPRVTFFGLDNSHGKGMQQMASVADLVQKAQNSGVTAQSLRRTLEQERAAGRISEATYRGFAEGLPVEGGASQDAAGAVGSPLHASDGAEPSRQDAGPAGPGAGTLAQGVGQRGAYSPTAKTIALFKGADLSTFVHEAGHFFLDMQTDLAARLYAQQQDGAALSEGERALLDDTLKLLDWMGVKGTPELSALDNWASMTLDEQRQAHEQFARGFEAYAFEGRAPSVELQGVFQRFRAWLLQIYRSLKSLNVELTEEVRGVMDRMLATTEQITEAEAARKMGALFHSETDGGMTPEEFKAYHDLAVGATQEAIDNLQARGLTDMQWLSRARAKVLKDLQRQHLEARRELGAEVRAEVMARPIYRAWQWLTRRGETAEGTAAAARAKAAGVDVANDSLLTAIAKLGGISIESARRDLSIETDERPDSGVFGKPVFRKEGGRGADDMREALTELGYLTRYDEHGRTEMRELEELVADELGGTPRFAAGYNWGEDAPKGFISPDATHGKLRTADLREMFGAGPDALWRKLSTLRMTSDSTGVHPDLVADFFGFDSGEALVRALAEAEHPQTVIDGIVDQRMLERHGDLATPEGLQRAADEAIHNDVRARMVATELEALQRAGQVRQKVPGQRSTVDVLAKAARQVAEQIVGRLKIRDIRPAQYAAAEARAAKEAAKAFKAGDIAAAAEAKRNQLIQHRAAQAAYAAQNEAEATVRYLRRFDKASSTIDAEYRDQIETLLDRFELRPASLKQIDRRKSLAEWAEAQREQGMEPDIPPALLDEAQRKHWREMTMEELRGLADTVRQIEHLGRLKHKLLTAKDAREWGVIRDEIAASIHANAEGKQAVTRSPATTGERWMAGMKGFLAAHIKVANWARIMDGGKDGGPVWEHLVRGANDAANLETTMRAQATQALHDILEPLLAGGPLARRKVLYPSINRSLTREQVIGIALNMGNEGNIQRLLGGEGWTLQQLQPVLSTLTSAEWQAVQKVWDHLETYRPLIGAKEKRVYGKEPAWVEPLPLRVQTADGQALDLRGGYFPIKYDPAASLGAEQHNDAEDAKRQMQGAYTSATTRRGFTKSRVEEVRGRPLLYGLAAVYGGVNDVVHDLAWHEWLIDANKILRSDAIDGAMREHYGPEVVRQFKSWVQDVAAGEAPARAALDAALSRLRHGVSVAGLGFNVMSALIQPLGFTQSMVRIGPQWAAKGLMQYLGGPVSLTREVSEKSDFMRERQRTRFRELNELRNQVEGQTKAKELTGRYAYWLMMRCQQMVDVPTWQGAYEKAISEGNDEERSIALADQAVIDSQGGGQLKDQAAIERGGPALKLFTVFYSFMNTAANIGYAEAMTQKSRARMAANMLLLYTVPAVLGVALKDALTPGDSGDWDDWRKLMRKMLGEQLSYLMGLMVVSREFAEAGKSMTGAAERPRDYGGPAGLRVIADVTTLGKQVHQGEFDDQFRKAFVNVLGSLAGLPAAQANRTITGAKALAEGRTMNPAALLLGYQEPR